MSTLHGEWIEKGRRVGREEGREEGALLAMRKSVVDVLGARFGEVDSSVVDSIKGITNPAALEALHRFAVTVDTPDAFQAELRRTAP